MSSEDEKKIENQGSRESGEIQTIHEMITEALMGTGTNTTPLDSVYTDANFQTDHFPPDQRSNMYMNNETGSLTLGKLYYQFKDLDSRLTRVEEVIYKREDAVGKKRATTMARSEFPSDPCFGLDQGTSPSRLSDITTINPILTSSNDILSISSFQNSLSYTLPTQPSSSKVQKKDDIKVAKMIFQFKLICYLEV